MRRCLSSTLLLLLLASSPAATAADRLAVYTVNAPLAYFAERIGGDAVEVVFPAPPDRDPAFWRPSIAVIAEYQAADLVLLNGADYAAWTQKTSLPRAKLVDTSRAFADQLIVTQNAVTHSHGPEGEHSHAATASITWLDFDQAAQQARAIADALKRRLPEQAAALEEGMTALEADLRALDQRAMAIGKSAAGTPLIASHPRYQYLARRYGLNIESVEWEAGETPGPEQLAALDALRKDHPARWMLWEALPSDGAIALLEERGMESIVFSPAANVGPDGDFLAVMERNLDALQRITSPGN
jgi:zinc transport system substrate-binding protein